MPQVDITVIGDAPSTEQKNVLFEKITDLMVNLLGRTRKSVVVSITSDAASNWAVGGAPPEGVGVVGVQAVVKILAGTNSDDQKARMVAEATKALRSQLGDPVMPLYVTFEEVEATGWGYDGRTVAEIRQAAAGKST